MYYIPGYDFFELQFMMECYYVHYGMNPVFGNHLPLQKLHL